jgi:osmotically-inducible protein OsmY
MSDDVLLRQNVLDELDFRPDVDAANVGVSAEKGVVTLTGHVKSYAQKFAAVEATKALAGVVAVADEIEVRSEADYSDVDDDSIAQRAVNSLAWNTTIPRGGVKVTVDHGWATLSGEVSWQYQKSAAAEALRTLYGILGVTNNITLKTQPQPADVRSRIQKAFERSAQLDSGAITFVISDGAVTLQGTVDSWAARDRAEDAVWSAAGVCNVVDNLVVQ